MYFSLKNTPAEPDPSGTPRGPKAANRVSSVVVSLGIVSMLTDVSSESVSAIPPPYVTSVIGLSTVAYEVLDGLHHGVSAVVRLGAGWAADRIGPPKWVALSGHGLAADARIFLLFVTSFAGPTAVLAASFGMHRTPDNIGAAVITILCLVLLSGYYAPIDGILSMLIVSTAIAFVIPIVAVILRSARRYRADVAA